MPAAPAAASCGTCSRAYLRSPLLRNENIAASWTSSTVTKLHTFMGSFAFATRFLDALAVSSSYTSSSMRNTPSEFLYL